MNEERTEAAEPTNNGPRRWLIIGGVLFIIAAVALVWWLMGRALRQPKTQ